MKIAKFKETNGVEYHLIDVFNVFDALSESCKCDQSDLSNGKCVTDMAYDVKVIQKIEIQYIKDEPFIQAAFTKCLISVPIRNCKNTLCCQK